MRGWGEMGSTLASGGSAGSLPVICLRPVMTPRACSWQRVRDCPSKAGPAGAAAVTL